MHRPAVAAHAIAAVEGAAEEHVLCADEDGWFLRVEIPIAAGFVEFLAAHEDNGGMLCEPL